MKVACTWGDGPDIMVTLEGKRVVLYEKPRNDPPPRGQFEHGFVTEGSFDLTADEASSLASALLNAVSQVKALELQCKLADNPNDKYCDNPNCRGGIGPHMLSECPYPDPR